MTLRWQLAALVLIILLAACTRSTDPKFVNNDDCQNVNRAALPRTVAKLHFDTGYETEVSAEVASTPEGRLQGLMCRREVGVGTGMLFLFDQERDGQFWMYNTYVDLDIVYISSSGSIADVKRMTSCIRSEGESDTQWSARCQSEATNYAPGQPYTATIELPAGWLEAVTEDGATLIGVTWE